MNAIPNYYGIAGDSEEEIYRIILKAVPDNDVIVLTGGISMGDYDIVPEILEKAKFKLLFKSVAIQPGKPTVFGSLDNKLCFGLPGNPVSSYIIFELMVKPLLFKMMRMDYSPLYIKMPMGTTYKRKTTDRMAWIPVIITKDGYVMPVEIHGSAHVNALCKADGLVSIALGKESLRKGEKVYVRQI